MNQPKNAYYYCGRATGAGDCKARGIPESRLREAVITPLEGLVSKLQHKKMRAVVRDHLELQQAATEAKDDLSRAKLEAAYERLDTRLTRLEDLYLDGTWSRDRYLERRERIQTELEAVKAELAAIPQLVRPDTNELFAIADALDGAPQDDHEWRDIISQTVERVVIRKSEVSVEWRDVYGPLLAR
jgi:hypothetical protein